MWGTTIIIVDIVIVTVIKIATMINFTWHRDEVPAVVGEGEASDEFWVAGHGGHALASVVVVDRLRGGHHEHDEQDHDQDDDEQDKEIS